MVLLDIVLHTGFLKSFVIDIYNEGLAYRLNGLWKVLMCTKKSVEALKRL